MEKIKIYLESDNRNYDEGLMLLTKYSKNRILSQRLARKPWVEKLEYELQKLVDRADLLKGVVKQKKAVQKVDAEKAAFIESLPEVLEVKRNFVVRSKHSMSYNDLPSDLRVIWDETAELYKHSRSLHEKLKLMFNSSDKERKPLVENLMKLQTKVRENWDKIDSYNPEDHLPKEFPVNSIDAKRISANRAYISRNSKSAELGSDLFDKVQIRITEIISAGESFSDSQNTILKDLGFNMQNPSGE